MRKSIIGIVLVLFVFVSCDEETIDEIKIPTDGLIANYLFENDLNDDSGNDNHGTLNGVSFSADRFENDYSAGYFDGFSHVVLNETILPTDGSDFSISVWVYSENENTNGVRTIIGQYDGELLGRFQIYEYEGHYKVFYGTEPLSGNAYVLDEVENNVWVNLLLISSNGKAKIFKNGTLMKDDMSIGQLGETVTKIGESGEYRRFYHGKIDDVRIYNRVLSEVEVKLLYHEGRWDK